MTLNSAELQFWEIKQLYVSRHNTWFWKEKKVSLLKSLKLHSLEIKSLLQKQELFSSVDYKYNSVFLDRNSEIQNTILSKQILVHLTFLNSTTTSFLCLLIVWKESKPEVCYVLNLFQVIKILHNYFQEMHFEQYLYTRFHFHYRSSNQTGSWNNYSCLHYCTIKQSLLGLCWKKKRILNGRINNCLKGQCWKEL